jgi:beta-lactamase regulating signal transducer with metallopeptidase domain
VGQRADRSRDHVGRAVNILADPAACIAGRRLPAIGNAVVLEVALPAAYCVPGRPAAIVLTSGALDLLDPAQLTAVIAHEQAHLAGSHHMLVALARGLAASFPGVPLFARGADEVARLTEMCADDKAGRISGRNVLIGALLAMGGGAAMPAFTLAAAANDVAARVQRLLEQPRRDERVRNRPALLALIALLAVASGLLTRSADPLVVRAITAIA